MDDKDFNNAKTALDWIKTIESASASVRDSDIYPILNTWINQTSPNEILEIGCGQGICSDKINLIGRCYTGLEPSALLLERAIHLYQNKNRNFRLGSAYNLPFQDNSFDASFSVALIHLLSDNSTSQDILYLNTREEIADALQAANLIVSEVKTFRRSEKSTGQAYYISLQGQKI